MVRSLRAIRAIKLDGYTLLDFNSLEIAVALHDEARRKRDELLVFLAANGVAVRDLARVVGLSRQRVHQIIRSRPAPAR